ncbi:MAG: isoprenylcysteine carboxylmethyltransferase family protein [Sphingomonas sp.]|nr:isoprenylcysteine carboxylmethyltransferase family protein [Sphingomonas sp.]
MAESDRGAGVMFPPPFVYLGLLLLGPVVDRLVPLAPLTIAGGFSAVLLFPGFILIGIAIGLFRRRGENPNPATATGGIIDTGIYRFTRNPMYLGMSIAYLGFAILLHSIGALVLWPLAVIIIRTQVIAREERYLEAKFGADYLQYKTRVRRWL